jgi:ABC-type phosphate transport system auxiliary subunit
MLSKKNTAVLFAAISLSLSACGTNTSETPKKTTTLSIADGATQMKETLKQLNTDLTAKDAGKVKTDSENLEKSWSKFEDNVKEKDQALYGKVEDPLGIIEAGAKASSLDQATLTKASKDLDTVLTDVANIDSKKSTEVSIADGATQMKDTLKQLNTDLSAKDAGKVKTDSENLEKSWSQFEDNVKAKDQALYGKVEDPLGIIEAGAKASQLDQATLTKASKDLDAVLTDVAKLK